MPSSYLGPSSPPHAAGVSEEGVGAVWPSPPPGVSGAASPPQAVNLGVGGAAGVGARDEPESPPVIPGVGAS